MRNQASRRMALCGITASLMMVVMMMGSLLPLATYACPMLAGALIIPIVWECEEGRNPFEIKTLDGEPLRINVGNTYMAIIGFDTERVEWAEVIPPETEPPVTEAEQTVPETITETISETVAETTEETVDAQ